MLWHKKRWKIALKSRQRNAVAMNTISGQRGRGDGASANSILTSCRRPRGDPPSESTWLAGNRVSGCSAGRRVEKQSPAPHEGRPTEGTDACMAPTPCDRLAMKEERSCRVQKGAIIKPSQNSHKEQQRAGRTEKA